MTGCTPRPSAPALRDDPVYQNDREGFHFLAPEGWQQSVRSDIPPGKVDKERPLVNYQRNTGVTPASIRVSLADLPASTDILLEALAEPDQGLAPFGSRPGGVKVEKIDPLFPKL